MRATLEVAASPDTSAHGRGAGTGLVAERARALLEALGLDLQDPHLRGTPERMARSLAELFAGLGAPAPELRTFPNPEPTRELVRLSGIAFHSVCAHHLLPFFGQVEVAYLPGDRLVGLSKLARAVEHFARRPQVQERMTEQIADFLHAGLRARGVSVSVEARHLCMEMRGVRRAGTLTCTRAVRGELRRQGVG